MKFGDLLRWLILPLAIALTAFITARASRVLYLQPLRSRARPVTSYAEALARVEYLRTHFDEGLPVKPACKPYLLSHGEKTKRVVVYYHGFTNCPKQFARLGQIFYENGYNVLVPRMPYHGLEDRTQMRNLTAEALAQELDDTIDIARGLGEEVIVIGLSGGGTMATWAAQFRADVDRAVLIAPLLSVPFAPPSVVYLFDVLLLLLPNWWVWWDPIKKQKRDWGVPHAYPGYATHAQAQTMRLGLSALKAAKESKPAARSIVMVTNAADMSVDNRICDKLVAHWRRQGVNVTTYLFPKEMKLIHDCIDPMQPQQQIDTVYPVLINLVEAPVATAQDVAPLSHKM